MKFYFLPFVFLLISCAKEKTNSNSQMTPIVGIQPYNEISLKDAQLVSNAIDSFYRYKVVVLPVKKMFKKAFVKIKSPRYRADSIIKFQNQQIPKNVNYILGVTNEDISITKHDKNGEILEPKWKYCDFGIMGLAYRPGKSAIVSKFRIKSTNKKLEALRLKKVAIHEFGHNLGLAHCPNKNCVMTSAAEKLATIDHEKMALCEKCKKIINYKY